MVRERSRLKNYSLDDIDEFIPDSYSDDPWLSTPKKHLWFVVMI